MKTHCRHMNLLTSALTLMGLAWLQACVPSVPQEYDLNCPEPVVECRPGQWRGTPFDTATSRPGASYLKIEHVAGINSPAGEFGLAFRTDRDALLTGGDGAVQSLVGVELQRAAAGTRSGAYSAPGISTFGGGGVVPIVVFSGVADTAVTGDANIYIAERGRDGFSNIRALDALNTPLWWDGHPTSSPDGNVIIFASERPTSLGGADLWYSRRGAGGTWAEPQNCGTALNTICDELSPFITPDGRTLLFSSAGHETVGGYDICSVALDLEALKAGRPHDAFGAVTNMGRPLNTASDEIFPSTPAGHDTLLYYSSNQTAPTGTAEGRHGGFDVFVLHRVHVPADPTIAAATPKVPVKTEPKEPVRRLDTLALNRPEAEPLPEGEPEVEAPNETEVEAPDEPVADKPRDIVVEGRVVDKSSQQPLPEVEVTMKELKSDEIKARTRTDDEGAYRLEGRVEGGVEVTAQAETYFPRSSKIDGPDGGKELQRDFELTADLTLRLNFPNDIYQEPYPNILDSNGRQTNQTWQEAVATLANHISLYQKSIKSIVLIGHTDEKASEEYNLMLGRRRAEFLKQQLMARGVPENLLVTNSAGETRPLARRAGEDFETWYTRCRRVEIRKILQE